MPVTVTSVPIGAELGDKPVIPGVTVKLCELLATPFTVTTTPTTAGVKLLGTVTTTLVADQLVAVATVPFKVTVLVPWAVPKSVPVMVSEVPIGPEVGERLVMLGMTVKLAVLLETPFTVTTTLTEPGARLVGTETTKAVALQLDGETALPLKVTVLEPWFAPNPLPAMVSEAPMGAGLGEIPVMITGTVKLTALLASPPTVTTTLPEVAATGTVAMILVSPQLLMAAAAPLKVTVFVP